MPASHYNRLDDSSLIQLWKAGDRMAAQTLFLRYTDALRRFFARRVRHGSDDLLQQTLLALLEGRDRLRSPDQFRGYVFGTARIQLLMHLRRRRRISETVFEEAHEELVNELVDPDCFDPESCVRVCNAVARLHPDFRRVVHMVFWEGRSAVEISRTLGVPVGTVYSRLQRARERLLAAEVAHARAETAYTQGV